VQPVCCSWQLPLAGISTQQPLSQQLVPPLCHRYFAAAKTLPRFYWTGMSRPGSFNLYAFPDTSYLSQVVSNDPYAHW
jgi:hypothetical protein